MEDDEALILLPPKRIKLIKWSKCLICQVDTGEAIRQGTEAGINSFTSACKQRNDELYERIYKDFERLSEFNVVWHGKCFQSYTSKRNLSFVRAKSPSDPSLSKPCDISESTDARMSRSKVSQTDWNLCMFCQKKKHKGVKEMCTVCTFDACKTIQNAAELREDEEMMIRIKDIDLIAAEAKYHKSCHSQYVSKTNLKHQLFKEVNKQEESLYAKAFQRIAAEIERRIAGGEAYDMQSLLSRFKVALS